MAAADAAERDWTLPVAQAVHALVDLAVKRPATNPGPWTVSFTNDGRPHITYRASSAHASSVLISEPGWYRFVWGPSLEKLAACLWTTLAEDLALIGVSVEIPTKEQRQEMYWGPMPVEGGGSCMPNWAVRAQGARERYLAQLEAVAEPLDPLPWDTPRRRPRQEELDARLAARQSAEQRTPAEPALPEAWRPGHFGKGFRSASGRTYAWLCSHPDQGGHPQHRQAEILIAHHEPGPMLERGRELTGTEIAHMCPIVIAPDGTYTHDSAEPLWRGNRHMPELAAQAAELLERFPAERFAEQNPALKYVADREVWAERFIGAGRAYGHAASVLEILDRQDRVGS